jgi:hypothetical protein
MQIQSSNPTEISVFVATNGHAVVFQGPGFPSKQAFIVERQQLSRFLADPTATPILLLPPFAAASVEALLCGGELESLAIHRDLVLGQEWRIIFSLRNGKKIAYSSDHEVATEVRWLAGKNVSVVVTPMAAISVHTTGGKIQLSVIASVPAPESPNYPKRFAAPPPTIVQALRAELAKSQPLLRYEN